MAEQSAEAGEMVESATAAASEEEGAHGRDPRFAPPWITDNPELFADLRARSTAEPKPATASRSEAIAPIVNLEQLEVRAGGSEFVDVAQTAGGRLPLLTRVSLALCPSQAAIARAVQPRAADVITVRPPPATQRNANGRSKMAKDATR